MDFEDWLQTVPSLALRELAGVDHNFHAAIGGVREYVLSTPGPRANAEQSWRTEVNARAAVAAMCPRKVRDAKLRYGMVD